MAIKNYEELFSSLKGVSSPVEVQKILQEIGDHRGVALNEVFNTELKLKWVPYGDKISNISTIGLASNAGRSITERVTNAIDAILEERAGKSPSKPNSPQQAASDWFGRPQSSPDNGLYRWDYSKGNYDRKIHVVMTKGDLQEAPTIDIVDGGIGIKEDEFWKTSLTLQEGNKITKKFCVGAFGQGGSSTLAFCPFVLIASKHSDRPKTVSFTLTRLIKLDDNYKEDCYAYLAVDNDNSDNSREHLVPSFELESTSELKLYDAPEKIKLPEFNQGTLIRHYGFNLTNLSGILSPASGNLYHFFQFAMFDPLIPIRILDLREKGKEKSEIIKGSRNRLMTYTLRAKDDEEEIGNTELKAFRPMEFVVPYSADEACIGIEYWVIFNYEKQKDGSTTIRKGGSNSLFIQRGTPIIGTMNGQNQGSLPGKILRDAGLSLVSKHMVIHIDATNAPNSIRRELFATTREFFKEGPVLQSVLQVLEKKLKEDDELHELEKLLTEKLTARETETTKDEVREQISRLLIEAGFAPTSAGPSPEEGAGEVQAVKERKHHKPHVADPLPTLPFPEVSRFEIVSPKPIMSIRKNDTETLLVETDADSQFYREKRIAIRFEPNDLEVASELQLKGGRMRWRVRVKEGSSIGSKGNIIATLTKVDGAQLSDEIQYEILPELEKPSKKEKGIVPPFEVIAINPEDDRWGDVWDNLADDQKRFSTVAYKQMNIEGKIIVYYSTIFLPYAQQVENLKSRSESLSQLFTTQYEIWIGYHAILQEKAKQNLEEEKDIEQQLEDERIRVAQLQVKQAMRMAEMIHKYSKESLTGE